MGVTKMSSQQDSTPTLRATSTLPHYKSFAMLPQDNVYYGIVWLKATSGSVPAQIPLVKGYVWTSKTKLT